MPRLTLEMRRSLAFLVALAALTAACGGGSDLEMEADGDGIVTLPTNPFSNDGPVVFRDLISPIANGTIILRVEHEGRVGYDFMESAAFNVEYWRGHHDVGEYTLTVTLF